MESTELCVSVSRDTMLFSDTGQVLKANVIPTIAHYKQVKFKQYVTTDQNDYKSQKHQNHLLQTREQ